MSVDRKEIDLIIRAALQGGKTLDGVTKSIADIEKALTAQAQAAKRGESSIDELKATLLALQKVQDQLKDQAGLIGQFDRLGKQLAVSAEKADKAAKAHDEYRDKLDKAGKATEFQAGKLIKLANASERNQTTLAKQRTDYEALGATLKEAGIDIGNMATAETQARQAAAQLGITINAAQQAISTYGEDVRKARDESKKLAEDTAFEKKLAEAAQLVKAADYVNFWTEALNKADLAEQQLKINASLRQSADDAIAAARGYKTLGTAAKSLGSSTGGLRAVVDAIINPTKASNATLSGVEAEIKRIGEAAASAKGPITDYRSQLSQLTTAAKSIGDKSSLVDSFNRQVAALRDARAGYSDARAKVLQYAEALRTSTGNNDALQASLRAAQTTLAAAQRSLAEQLTTTRALREEMRQAGMSTTKLADTEARLTQAARQSVDALNGLVAAKKKYGESARNAAEAQDLFSNSGRTTLSWMQRLRGEILSLVAAYAGIYGAIQGAERALDAFNAKQAIQNQLALTVGNDNAKIANEYAYIRGQADRLGLAFESAAKGYAKFSAAASLAGRDSQEIRYIFESFAEVGRVAGLSAENMDGVFKALEQVISKGSIQAEELRGQLGDRLFGAFQVAAEALKEQFPNLDKAMKEGKVTSEQLIKIAEKYKEIVGDRLPQATQSLIANQERLNSTLFDFKVLIAEQGFADEYSKLLQSLTTFFQSDDGKKFAKDLSDGFSSIAASLRWMVENSQIIKDVLIAGVLIFGAKQAVSMGIALAALPAKISAVAVAFGEATLAMKLLQGAFAVFTVAIVAWEIGKILNEKFVFVRQWGVGMVYLFETTWTSIKYGAQIVWAEIPAVFMDGMALLVNVLTSGFRTVLGIFASASRALGKDDLAKALETAISTIEMKVGRVGNASAQLRKQLSADLKEIKKITSGMMQDVSATPSATVGNPADPATAKPTSVKPGRKIDDEKDAERRIKLKEQLENELTSLEAKIERNEKDSLSRRLEAIDLTYQKMSKKIKSLGGSDGAEMQARLASNVNELKLQETRKFNDALLSDQEQLQRKLETIESAAGRKEKTDLQARLDSVRAQYEQTYRDIEAYREKLVLNGRDTAGVDAYKTRLDAGVVSLQNLERQKYYEDAVNSILDQRKAKLDLIAVQEKTGLITTVQAREMAAATITETQPKIEALVEEGLNYANAMLAAAEATGASSTALDTLVAKLTEARGSAAGLKTEFLSAQQVNEMLTSGATTAFTTMEEAIIGAATGMRSWSDAIRATRNAFLSFAADFLKQIATMILKQMILNALTGSSRGSVGGLISSAVNATVKHRGGVVGNGGVSRAANAEWFTNAPRYHGGGIAGLAPDEYPAVLKKNEEVLTESDPRNVLNGGTSNQQSPQLNAKIINMIDSASVVSEGLSSQEGERTFINVIRANRSSIKQILG